MLRTFGHRVATCCDMLGVVGSSLKMVKFEPTTPNMSQHIATRWPNARNMLRPTMLRYAALACCNRLAGVYIEQVSNPLRYYNFTVSVWKSEKIQELYLNKSKKKLQSQIIYLFLFTRFLSLQIIRMLFVLYSHSADRYDPDGGLDACNLAAKEKAK